MALDFFISRTSCFRYLPYYTALVLFSQAIPVTKGRNYIIFYTNFRFLSISLSICNEWCNIFTSYS
ncbi:hypothetical protein B7708_07135 [Streptococcus oralis subsp. dentisani]|uniref:Uncharacterized protein n=1 Tax=Streptococcus oralis subsp. dentisani TaxID=1458253 RepID=A0A1X1IPP8_STROR|nr:hypothetical protein B7708_07135 [Streptococcus oralis subsp. dentisani]